MELLQRVLEAAGIRDTEAAWNEAFDKAAIWNADGEWYGSRAYEYIIENCPGLDTRISGDEMEQFMHDFAASLNVNKEKFLYRKNLAESGKAPYRTDENEERLWSVHMEKKDGTGDCIIRDKNGITVTYVKPDGTAGEHRADYGYCAALVMRMIEEDEYLG